MNSSTDLSRYDNSWYDPGRNAFVRFLWYVCNATLLTGRIPGSSWRRGLLRLFGAGIGKGVVIKPAVNIKYPWKLTVGDHAWIGERVWIDNLDQVSIGEHACLSQGATLICGNHNYKSSGFDLQLGAITIENGAWIGAGASVAPGVRCGTHAVLSMGSVAYNDLDAWGIYSGVPAVKVREREIGL